MIIVQDLENILKFLLILKINLLLVFTYLLEKSRFVSIAYSQRNYHIFLSNCLNFLIKEKFNYECIKN